MEEGMPSHQSALIASPNQPRVFLKKGTAEAFGCRGPGSKRLEMPLKPLSKAEKRSKWHKNNKKSLEKCMKWLEMSPNRLERCRFGADVGPKARGRAHSPGRALQPAQRRCVGLPDQLGWRFREHLRASDLAKSKPTII